MCLKLFITESIQIGFNISGNSSNILLQIFQIAVKILLSRFAEQQEHLFRTACSNVLNSDHAKNCRNQHGYNDSADCHS